MKMPRAKELTVFETMLLVTFGVAAPLIIGALLIPYIHYIFFILLIGWIPYSIWLILCYYYRRKDQIRDEATIKL
jgi:hypothetical protein